MASAKLGCLRTPFLPDLIGLCLLCKLKVTMILSEQMEEDVVDQQSFGALKVSPFCKGRLLTPVRGISCAI